MTLFLEYSEIFEKALTTLVNDDGFMLISSDRAQRAHLCAHKLLEFVEQNRSTGLVADFCDGLLRSLQSCIDSHPRKMKYHYLREKIWEQYYKLVSSEKFKDMWVQFLQSSIGFEACPQYITEELMQILLKKKIFKCLQLRY